MTEDGECQLLVRVPKIKMLRVNYGSTAAAWSLKNTSVAVKWRASVTFIQMTGEDLGWILGLELYTSS